MRYIIATTIAVLLVSLSIAGTRLTPDDGMSQVDWGEYIAQQGPALAYRAFAERVSGLPSSLQHTYAHTFGGALYETTGVEGIAVCDDRFLYGCFHEFMGRAVVDLGMEAAETLNAICAKQLGEKAVFCQHGIGHGVQSYFGYERENLDQAIALCDTLEQESEVGGCYGGVFMEYNLRTMAGSNAEARHISNGVIAAPCDSLAAEYRPACFFWQPQWWHVALLGGTGTSTALFAQLGDYCQIATGNEEERVTCARGIGSDAAIATQLETMRTAELCDVATHTARERLACRTQAARRVANVYPEQAARVCEGLPETDFTRCVVGITERTMEL